MKRFPLYSLYDVQLKTLGKQFAQVMQEELGKSLLKIFFMTVTLLEDKAQPPKWI